MPPRSRRTVRHRTGYGFWDYFTLLSGHDYFREAFGGDPTPAALAKAWADLGEEMIALHSQHYSGTRPWGWWEFEAPERRQRVDEKPHPFDDPACPAQHKVLYYGRPGHLWLEDHFEAVYECQCAYLARLRLFTPVEKRLAQSPEWGCWEEDEDASWRHHGLTLDQIKVWLEAAV